MSKADKAPAEERAGYNSMEPQALDQHRGWDIEKDVEDVEDRDGNLGAILVNGRQEVGRWRNVRCIENPRDAGLCSGLA
jgi:hypothetical protein